MKIALMHEQQVPPLAPPVLLNRRGSAGMTVSNR